MLETVSSVLLRRLNPFSPHPIAVALSGGGDSVALLLAAHAWAERAGRPLLALTVDHQLQPQSQEWTGACAELARRLGVGFQALAWDGAKPARGLPAAARAARHRLLAEAARAAGARVVLLGHTADDVLEARAMRLEGSTTPQPREWSPSPAWPQGRGLFLLRPLLGVRRAALRDWLTAHGEPWIEDPANADPRFARARARARGGLGDPADPDPLRDEPPLELAGLVRPLAGGLLVSRAALRDTTLAEANRLVALASVCAGGGARAPSAASRERLAVALRGHGPVAATLAGARIWADAESVGFAREAGEAARGGLAPLSLPPGRPVVWDGRFELIAGQAGLEVRALRGLARRLPEDQQRALAALPAPLRPALPAVVHGSGAVGCPLLGAWEVKVASLVEHRFIAAAGLIAREPE